MTFFNARMKLVPRVWNNQTQKEYEEIFHDLMCGGMLRFHATIRKEEFYKKHLAAIWIRRIFLYLILPDYAIKCRIKA